MPGAAAVNADEAATRPKAEQEEQEGREAALFSKGGEKLRVGSALEIESVNEPFPAPQPSGTRPTQSFSFLVIVLFLSRRTRNEYENEER